MAVLDNTSSKDIDLSEVLSPIKLPCGRVLSNRLVKAATYEHLAPFLGGPPNAPLKALYKVWAYGGWGMVITGNVQISRTHLSLGADMVIPENLSEEKIRHFKELALSMKGFGPNGVADTAIIRDSTCPLAIMQLNHTGRQSPNGLGGRWPFIQPPLSASATHVGTSSKTGQADSLLTRVANAALFQTARAMTGADIKDVLEGFVRGARLAVESGFDGVQIHAAHGYLIAQFISRKTNLRSDAYASPLALLHDIVQAVRMSVPKAFVVGLKLNAADYSTGGLSESEGAAHLAEIARWEWDGAGIDFIEISGGDYESPEFMQDSSPRQAFFESFSRIAVDTVHQDQDQSSSSPFKKPSPLIMLTGGLRTRAQFSQVLKRQHAHLIGLARMATLQPNLPNLLREYHEGSKTSIKVEGSPNHLLWSWETQPAPEPHSPKWWPRLIGAGVGMAWYVVALRRLALGQNLPFGENWILIILEMYFGALWNRRTVGIVFGLILAVLTLFFAL